MTSVDDLLLLSDLPLEVEEFANIGAWHYDLNVEKITWTKNLYRIYEIDKHQFNGDFKDYINYLHPDDLDYVHKVIKRAIKEKDAFSFDKRIITGKDRVKHIRTWGTVILDDEQNPVRITGLSMDVTDTIKSELALKESEQFNRKLVEHTPVAVIIQAMEGHILYANQTAADLLKAPTAEFLLHKHLPDFILSESNTNQKQLQSGSQKVEQTFKCTDGSTKIGESVIAPFEYKGKQTALILINDVTELKKGFIALESSESQLRYFVESTPLAVAMFDTNMNYLACSEKYLEDWWVKDEYMAPSGMIGLNHYELFTDVTEEWKKIHKETLAGRVLHRENDTFIKANGKKEWLRSKTQPWRNASGEIGGMILFTEFITERKEAEEAVANSRNRLNTLIQNLPGMVYSCGPPPDYEIRFVSAGCYEITGYKPEEFFGENRITFEQAAHPEDLKVARKTIADSVASKKPFECNYRLYTKDKKLRHINERGQAVFAQHGEVLSVEGVVTDVTEKMEAEKALINSEEQLRTAQRVSHLGSWEWDIKTKETFWSDEYFRICGEHPGAFTPTFEMGASFIHPDDREQTQKAIAKTLETGIPYHLGQRILRKNGTTRYVQSQGELVKDEKGNPFKLIGSIQDITERKLTEIALEESRNRNTALVNALPDLLFITTTDGYYLDIQIPESEKLLFPKEQLIGNHIKDFYNKEVADRFIEKSQLAEKTNQGQVLDYSLKKEGVTKHFEARIVKYEAGKVLAIIRDVTKNKEDEKNLVKLTEELTNTNAELKQFAYITSHDLRAPVVNLDTLLNIYTHKETPDKDREQVFDKIVASVSQLKSTLNDLIQLVSIKDDSKNTLTDIKLDEIANAVTNNLESQIKAAQAKIKTDFKKAPVVKSRRATVHSITQNLISNALKYSGKGKPIIELQSFIKDDHICLSVKDNGIGIDLKKHGDRLFGMYQRFHENKEGKGLGLYIIKSQIEALGGSIEVESEVDKGTTFNVCFKNI